MPHQFYEASRDVAGVASSHGGVYLTGHSLGGALATLVAARQSLPVVTFNAPGVARSFVGGSESTGLGIIRWARLDTSRMLHLRLAFDPISVATGPQLGTVRSVSTNQVAPTDVLGNHSIDTMVPALDRQEFHQEPDW